MVRREAYECCLCMFLFDFVVKEGATIVMMMERGGREGGREGGRKGLKKEGRKKDCPWRVMINSSSSSSSSSSSKEQQ